MLDKLTVDDFTSHVGETFPINIGEPEPFHVELIEAKTLGDPFELYGEDTTRRAPFSLIFRGPMQPVLRQMIQTLTHPTLGEMGIFMVPVGPDALGMRYQAIFT